MIHASISCENSSLLMGSKDGFLKPCNLMFALVSQHQTWKNQAEDNADLMVSKL